MSLDTLTFTVYNMTRDAFNNITPESQAPLVSLNQSSDTVKVIMCAADVAAASDFISQPDIRASIQECISKCMQGVFADGEVTLSDMPTLMTTVNEMASVINGLNEKRIGYVEISKRSIIPLIECVVSVLVQMLVPAPCLQIVRPVIRQCVKLLDTSVMSRVDKTPWFCIFN